MQTYFLFIFHLIIILIKNLFFKIISKSIFLKFIFLNRNHKNYNTQHIFKSINFKS